MADSLTLSSLAPGQQAVVMGIDAAAGDTGALLERLGFVAGTVVQMVRTAPFGDPLIVRIRGTQLAVRRADVASVQIAPT